MSSHSRSFATGILTSSPRPNVASISSSFPLTRTCVTSGTVAPSRNLDPNVWLAANVKCSAPTMNLLTTRSQKHDPNCDRNVVSAVSSQNASMPIAAKLA